MIFKSITRIDERTLRFYNVKWWKDEEVKKEFLLRQNYICSFCQCDIEDDEIDKCNVDHHIPKRFGGTEDSDNLRVVHDKCNSIKGSTLPLKDDVPFFIKIWWVSYFMDEVIRPMDYEQNMVNNKATPPKRERGFKIKEFEMEAA